MREQIRLAGGVSQYLKQQQAGAGPQNLGAMGAVGTIYTVFGQMRVGVTEEIKLLGELVKLNKRIADNTQAAGAVLA